MFTELDIAWLAGLMDGEASIVSLQDRRANHGLCFHLSMNMIDLPTMERAAEILRVLSGDVVAIRDKHPKSGFSRRLQFVVDVSSKAGCLRTLLALQPYLVTKRLQADLTIEVLRRAVQVSRYKATPLDYLTMKLVRRLKKEVEVGGEARAQAVMLLGQVTPSQAILRLAPLARDRMEGVETRRVRRNDNPVHERPAPTTAMVEDEDIVQTPSQSSGPNLNSSEEESVH